MASLPSVAKPQELEEVIILEQDNDENLRIPKTMEMNSLEYLMQIVELARCLTCFELPEHGEFLYTCGNDATHFVCPDCSPNVSKCPLCKDKQTWMQKRYGFSLKVNCYVMAVFV